MKLSPNLVSKIFDKGYSQMELTEALKVSAANLQKKLKENITNSTPMGRKYIRSVPFGQRRGVAAFERPPKRGRPRKIGRPKGGRRKANVARYVPVPKRAKVTIEHRASAKGQPPAIETGELYNGLHVKVTGDDEITAQSNGRQSRVLDDVENEDSRPFFRHIVHAYFKEEFKADVKAFLRGLLKS